MTDYEKALANARDALAIYLRYGPPHYGEPLCGYATNAIEALHDLLAAIATAVPAGYDEDEIADACIMAEVSDSKYEAIITYLGDNRRRAAARKGE